VLEVAGGGGRVGVLAYLTDQIAPEQVLVELCEGWVLDNEEHVEVVGWLLAPCDALTGLAL